MRRKGRCIMNTFLTIVVTFFAGMGAGLGTGFAGLSAAAVISPVLITFLDMEPYMAVGIALFLADTPSIASLVVITGLTINFTPKRKVMRTEKFPMVVEGTKLAK